MWKSQSRNFHNKRNDKSRGRSKSKSRNIVCFHYQKPCYKRFKCRFYKWDKSRERGEKKNEGDKKKVVAFASDGDEVSLVYKDNYINLASMDSDQIIGSDFMLLQMVISSQPTIVVTWAMYDGRLRHNKNHRQRWYLFKDQQREQVVLKRC